MRKQTISISERDLMFTIAGQLYNQAPNRQPRKADIIMQKFRDAFREIAVNCIEDYSLHIEHEKVYDWLHDTLFDIPEFCELNLSQVEYEKGISVDDENRAKYGITTAYDICDSESWKNDFIDLDAFIRNIHRKLLKIIYLDEDCFLCKHQDKENDSTLACGNSDECKNCSLNPNLKNNYECSRDPRGKYTFACKYDCFKSRYICCEECDDKIECEHKCDGKSAECGNAINHRTNTEEKE